MSHLLQMSRQQKSPWHYRIDGKGARALSGLRVLVSSSYDRVDELDATVGELLLEPTRIYAKAVRAVLDHYKVKHVVHGIAHITGGGLFENLERVLPDNASVTIRRDAWDVPGVFGWLASLGEVDDEEMFRVFNMGIGLVFVVSPFYADSVREQITKLGLPCWNLGTVAQGDRGVKWA